jgi:hypothetical protein
MNTRPPSTVTRWWAAAMIVVSLPFIPLMTGSATAVHSDAQEYHLPLWRWVWHRLADGTSPFWGGFDFAGQNVPGIGQAAIFYPPNAIFAWSDTVAAFRWWTMVHVWLAASGAFLWSWSRWRSRAGATVSAVVYALNGVFVLHFVHVNFTIALAWLPWMFLGLDLLIERWSAAGLVAFAAPLGMIALAGQPQILWAALVGIAIVCVVQLTVRRTGPRAALRVAAGGALGLGLAAVQLLPQYLFSRTSDRPQLVGDVALKSSATTTDLLTALFPWYKGGAARLPLIARDWSGGNTYHEVGNHIGLAAAGLAVVGIVACHRERRVMAVTLIGVLGVAMAMAWSTPLAPLIFRAVPLADRFRVWPRYLLLLNVAVACLAGLGTKVVLDAPRIWRRRLLLGGLAVTGFAVLIRLLTEVGGQLASGWVMVMTITIPLLSLLLIVGSLRLSNRSRAGVLVVVAVAVPSVLFALGAPWRSEGLSPDAAQAFFDAERSPLSVFDAPGGVDRWVENSTQLRGVQTVTDTARVNGYDPLIQQDFATVTGATYLGIFVDDRVWSPPGLLADVLRVTTLLGRGTAAPSDPSWTSEPSPPGSAFTVWHRTPRLPEAWVVGAVATDSLDGIADRLQDSATDLEGTVYLDDATLATDAFAGRSTVGPAGSVDGALGDTGEADFVVRADRDAVLVVSTSWLDGWSATVNGREVPVARADGAVLGIPVPAGTSRVRLEFHSPGLRFGGLLSLLSVSMLAGVVVVAAGRRRRITSG